MEGLQGATKYIYLWDKYEAEKYCCEGEHAKHKYPGANIDVMFQCKGHQRHHDNGYARYVDDCSDVFGVS